MAGIIISALWFAVSAQASEPLRGPYIGPFFGDWDRTDSLLLTTALSAMAIDWGQTRSIARNPARFTEGNPILGPHPSVARVDRYFALAMLGTAGVAGILTPTPRKWFLGGVTAVEVVVIISNRGAGIRANF
jgi:hypothetical protein